ncbi:MAG TPA: cyclic-di-AMP receptor [Feifaniaceae bacterium]|nr:cyclic-di-AMP receptor [Feifaniaceae bacterium]
MKLLFAVVQDDDAKSLVKALVEHEVSVTRISSTGEFLRGGNTTLMIGVEDIRVAPTLDLIREHSSRREILTAASSVLPAMGVDAVHTPVRVTVGGATVFVVDAEKYLKL